MLEGKELNRKWRLKKENRKSNEERNEIKILEKQMSVTLKRQERNEKRSEWKEKPIMKENEISCLKEMNSIKVM